MNGSVSSIVADSGSALFRRPILTVANGRRGWYGPRQPLRLRHDGPRRGGSARRPFVCTHTLPMPRKRGAYRRMGAVQARPISLRRRHLNLARWISGDALLAPRKLKRWCSRNLQPAPSFRSARRAKTQSGAVPGGYLSAPSRQIKTSPKTMEIRTRPCPQAASTIGHKWAPYMATSGQFQLAANKAELNTCKLTIIRRE